MDNNERLKLAKDWYNDKSTTKKEKVLLETLFPELAESEDERIRENCIHFLELQKEHHASTIEIDECIAWLEKQGEQKSAWSEEDELMLTSIVNTLKLTNGAEQMKIDWLKSLKNRVQPHWKPTEEQLNFLVDLRDNHGLYLEERRSLEELYNNLKKL